MATILAFAVILVVILSCSATTIDAKPFVITTSSTSIHRQKERANSCIGCINKIRGGDPYYESNPNYNENINNNAPTLADINNDGFYQSNYLSNTHHRPQPLLEVISNYFAELHKFSPTLFNGIASSVILFFLWQLPPSTSVSKILRNHFVCSHYNVFRKRRYHALLLSAFSHASFHHIAVNLYAYVMFGRSVKQILARQGIDLWVFVLTAAIFGNLTFLAFDKGGQGSCIGLSGVTLALLAFDSLVYPTKELRMIVSFIPITLPAYYLLIGLFVFSCLGIIGIVGGRTNVAHSTHAGGLVFGILFYDVKRGWMRRWSYRVKKGYNVLKGS